MQQVPPPLSANHLARARWLSCASRARAGSFSGSMRGAASATSGSTAGLHGHPYAYRIRNLRRILAED